MTSTVIRAVFDGAEDIAAPDGPTGPATPQPEPQDPPEAAAAAFPLNDTGNGRRVAHYFGEDLRHVPRVGWHAWTGAVWRSDDDALAVRRMTQRLQERIEAEVPHLRLTETEQAAQRRHDALRAEIAAETDPERKTKLRAEAAELSGKLWGRGSTRARHLSWAKTSGNTNTMRNAMSEAEVLLSVPVDLLDVDPLCINTESGLIRVSVTGGPGTGFSRTADVQIEDHARDSLTADGGRQLVTKIMPVHYDPAARCPTFDAFLARVQPDAEMRGFLQRWFGLSMTGLTGEQKFAFLYGAGANGKSVLVDLIARLMGDYSATAKIESLTGRNRRSGGDATPDLIPLVGARMVRASEPEEGERLQEGMIKELTGGEPILVRRLHGDFIEVHPKFKLTISGNHKPDIRGTDDGIWRRILLVPFEVQIPVEERDHRLGDKLFAERAGILNWLLAGLCDYLEGGLREPAAVRDATADYRADSDPIGRFLRERCELTGDPSDKVTARELMLGFNFDLDERGEGMWGERTVSLKFKALAGKRIPGLDGVYTASRSDTNYYRGIRFTDAFRSALDEAPRNAKGVPVARSRTAGSDD